MYIAYIYHICSISFYTCIPPFSRTISLSLSLSFSLNPYHHTSCKVCTTVLFKMISRFEGKNRKRFSFIKELNNKMQMIFYMLTHQMNRTCDEPSTFHFLFTYLFKFYRKGKTRSLYSILYVWGYDPDCNRVIISYKLFQ